MSSDSLAGSESNPEFRPDDWFSAAETIRLVREATLSRKSHVAVAKRAHAGLLRTWADLLIVKGVRQEKVEIPAQFWWAEGYAALTQNWQMGDFKTWIDKKVLVCAFGVKFHRGDLQKMLPGAAAIATPEQHRLAPPPKEAGGRPMSEHWPTWVAELALLIHEEGLPAGSGSKGAEDLISRVATRLAERGLESPARSTVQPTAVAVLQRQREAENPAD